MSSTALSASLPDPSRMAQVYTTNLPVPIRGGSYRTEEQRSGQDQVDITTTLPVLRKSGQGLETSNAVTLEIVVDETQLSMDVLNQTARNASLSTREAAASYARPPSSYRPAVQLIDTYI